MTKLLYDLGIDCFRRTENPEKIGAGLILLQDSVEIFLIAICEHLNISLKDYVKFPEYFKKIERKIEEDEKREETVPLQRQILFLNKQRVNIKHFGMLPRIEDCKDFPVTVKNFFQDLSTRYLKVDFSSITFASQVPKLMKEFVNWLNKKLDISPILIGGISQYQFVDIHPFLDGNGRTARLLSTLILYQNGYDFKRLFSISEYYDKNRRAYYDAIQSVRKNNMDMTFWLEYFTEGLKNQLIEVKIKGEIAIKRDIVIEKARRLNLNKRQQEILLYLVEEKQLSVEKILQKFNFVRRTIQRDLSKMIALKLIREVAKSKTDPTKYYELL